MKQRRRDTALKASSSLRCRDSLHICFLWYSLWINAWTPRNSPLIAIKLKPSTVSRSSIVFVSQLYISSRSPVNEHSKNLHFGYLQLTKMVFFQLNKDTDFVTINLALKTGLCWKVPLKATKFAWCHCLVGLLTYCHLAN